MPTSNNGGPVTNDRVEPLSVAHESGALSGRQKPLVTHAFSTRYEESRVCWGLGRLSAFCLPLVWLASWAERARLFERYDLGWLQVVFMVLELICIFGVFASLLAILFGFVEMLVWVFQRKRQPSCWRTLAGMGLAFLFLGSVIPTSTISTQAQLRSADMNSLRQLALANLNYESVHNYFPPLSGKNERPASDGKGLSWRVHILPYLEHAELYQQFRMDEPWDSPHNLALLPEMPEVYVSLWPLDEVTEGHTLFQRPVGHGAFDPGDGKGIRFSEISDGSSNTILVVQVDPNHAVPWTKPADYVFDPTDPLRGLGHAVRYPAWLAARCDGSVVATESDEASQDEFSAMFTRDAGDTPPERW